MDILVSAFVAARICGFHELTEKPPHGERKSHDVYRLAMQAFQQALQRGQVPPPDKRRPKKNEWRMSTLKRHVEGKSKPDQNAEEGAA